MNYFELYPGDYLRDTSALSLIEHGAYLLLMVSYYGKEQPLPSDSASLFRMAHAMTKTEQKAVMAVADAYFPIGDDGFRHNARADREIGKAAIRMDAAPEKKANEAERQRRHRERRAALFDGLRTYGVTPDFNAKTADLEALLHSHVTRDVTRDVTRHITATRPQTPHAIKEQELPTTSGAVAPADPIWGTGLDFLKRKGLPEKASRSFLGLLRKELADDLTLAGLLLEAERQDICEPQAWLTKAAKERKGGSGTRIAQASAEQPGGGRPQFKAAA